MVGVLLVHVAQVFLFGAFKFPRELTWVFGVVLLLLTLGMAFTGQVLRFDQDAYWGIGIGASILGRVPLVGAPLVHLLLGGPIIAGDTLSRFFALHVFIVPGLLLAFAGLHIWMVLKLGINEWPMPGRVVTRERYLQEYEELTRKDGVPFVPDAFQRDLTAAGLAVLAVIACAALLGPSGPSGPPDPTIVRAVPKPDFFFLWLYAALSLLPRNLETPLILTAPVIGSDCSSSCRSSPASARRAGGGGPFLCWPCSSSPSRSPRSPAWERPRPGRRTWTRGAATPSRRATSPRAPRSSVRARSCCRRSSAGTATRSAARVGSAAPRSTTSRRA